MTDRPNPEVASPLDQLPTPPTAGDGRSLAARTSSGAQWLAASAVVERALSFATTAILARLLEPRDFGLYALAFVAIDALGALKNLGLDAAIVQRRDADERAAETAAFVLPLMSSGLFILLFFAAPSVAVWLGAPEIAGPLRGLGVSIIVVGVGAVPNALLQKQMRFGPRVRATVLGSIVFSVVAISLATTGIGVWGLVVGHLARTATTTSVCWLSLGWRPRLRPNWAVLRAMLGFSVYVMAANLLGVANGSVSRVLVGRYLGPTDVGLFSLAYGLAYLFRGQVGPRLYQVAFPAFAEAQDDPERLRRGAARLIQVLLTVSFPFAVVLCLMPEAVLKLAYGAQWGAAAPVLTVLAIGGIFAGINTALYPLMLARGRSGAQFAASLVELAVFIGLAPSAMKSWGLAGAGAASAVCALVSTIQRTSIVSHDLSMRWRDWGRAVRSPATAAAAMSVALLATKATLVSAGDTATPWRAGLCGAASFVVYASVLWWTDPGLLRWLKDWVAAPLLRLRRRLAHLRTSTPAKETTL